MRRFAVIVILIVAALGPARETQAAGAREALIAALVARDQRLAPNGAVAGRDAGGRDAFVAYLRRRAGGVPVDDARVATALRRLDAGPGDALADLELRMVAAVGGWAAVATVTTPAPPAFEHDYVNAAGAVVAAPQGLPRAKVRAEAASLRRRLIQSGDLAADAPPLAADNPGLADAVRRFQARHGILPDGVAGPGTLAALAEPVEAQLARLQLNRRREAMLDPRGPGRRVEVNVPGYELRLIDGGRTVWRSRVIVGDDATPTPLLDDRIRFIELNPSWYVPDSIVAEVVAKERRQPGGMAAEGFARREGGRLVQRPGPNNALGRVKFAFPNQHAVYIHDTPHRGGFARGDRSLSHGCIRLEHPMELARLLLEGEGWDQRRLDAALSRSTTRRVALNEPVPIHLDYRTAWVDGDGRLQLRPDIYGLDRSGVIELPGKGMPPLAAPGAPVATSEPPPVTTLVQAVPG